MQFEGLITTWKLTHGVIKAKKAALNNSAVFCL